MNSSPPTNVLETSDLREHKVLKVSSGDIELRGTSDSQSVSVDAMGLFAVTVEDGRATV